MQRLGLIGGTGLDQWGKAVRSHAINSVYGTPSANLAEFHVGDLQVFFLPRHGDQHEIPPHAVNYQANIDAFRQLQVDGIVAVNAVGGISKNNQPGSLVVPDQLIDYTWGRESTYILDAIGLAHAEFAQPFAGNIRAGLMNAAFVSGVEVADGGCIGVTQGPRLETAAEVRRLKQDGCDVVGMTSMPEAVLAREAGLDYASLCVNANWAAGLEPDPVTMDAIVATLDSAMVKVRSLLAVFFQEFTNVP